ncbi:ectonucleotide pyrophosphatase/phosphodiesterase family member 6-like [Scleropages formosus]|uniref:glycerophosphocholine cholinephosphodiesterase n=1 Tax=Scleropages formosus TaxID=113540 RepID=A0A0P7X8R6_SCLFO|nr:ectonucleotide pyrophosphatase/phosphodiesterase family member 6-like [Scleropages formosus]
MTGNYMWDQASTKEFLIGTNPDSHLPMWWEGSEPLWVTVQKLKKHVFMYYWPGCEVPILGVKPTFCEEYVGSPSEKNFTDAIENALTALRDNADMAAVYYEKVDVEGHHYGPLSPQVQAAVRFVDSALQMLNRKIKEKNMQDNLNVIIFSDHGMTEIQWMEKVIELKSYINMSDIIKMMDRGPVVSLWPNPAKSEASIEKLPYWQNGTGGTQGWQHGWHGYDNEFVDMRGFFLAWGPDFKRSLRAAPIQTVDVYNVMCKVLGIEGLPNNGSWSRVEFILSGTSSWTRPSLLSSSALVLLALALSL